MVNFRHSLSINSCPRPRKRALTPHNWVSLSLDFTYSRYHKHADLRWTPPKNLMFSNIFLIPLSTQSNNLYDRIQSGIFATLIITKSEIHRPKISRTLVSATRSNGSWDFPNWSDLILWPSNVTVTPMPVVITFYHQNWISPAQQSANYHG